MGCYYTKRALYRKIKLFRECLGILQYPIDTLALCGQQENITIEQIPFQTVGLRGMAILGKEEGESDIILLSDKRSHSEQNFDCGHEFIHTGLHKNEPVKTFHCFDTVQPRQNKFLEWHANEGAAELTVPYERLLPMIKQEHAGLKTWREIEAFKEYLVVTFKVSPIVIKYRFESLKYEIEQYLNGVPLESLEILSDAKQKEKGIKVQSLNALSDETYLVDFGFYPLEIYE